MERGGEASGAQAAVSAGTLGCQASSYKVPAAYGNERRQVTIVVSVGFF